MCIAIRALAGSDVQAIASIVSTHAQEIEVRVTMEVETGEIRNRFSRVGG